MRGVACFDADQVFEKAMELFIEDVKENGLELYEDEFYDYLLDNEMLPEDCEEIPDYYMEDEVLHEKFFDMIIDSTDPIPDKYYERAAEYFEDEAEEHGYYARFTDQEKL